MNSVNEFVIPLDKGLLIRERFARQIENLFLVRLEFTSDWDTAKRTGNVWLRISGNEEQRRKAEEYTKAISNPETRIHFSIPDHLQQLISLKRDELAWQIQRESCSFVQYHNPSEFFLQGSEISVCTAISLLEAQFDCFGRLQSQCFPPSNQNEVQHPRQQTPLPPTHTSYGSDIIAKGAAVATRPLLPRGSLPPSEDHLKEFATKLGYTIEEIKIARSKLKFAVNENLLLQQLMTLFPRKFPGDVSSGNSNKVSRDSSQNVEVLSDMSTEMKPTGKNIKNNKEKSASDSKLRHIVVDGSNVAMSHGNRAVFSCKGIMICVNYFKQRGHKEITVFVPQWRKEASKPERPIVDQQILLDLEKERILAFTPSRRVNGRRVVCYDDRYIVRFAAENDGIIVSNDNFRDLEKENPEWKKVIDEKLLMYTFVKDCFMPPDDPLGRHGPKLDDFLKKGTIIQPKLCPYRKKCTYGAKCKFYHPERVERSSTPVNRNNLAESASKNDGNRRLQDTDAHDALLLLNAANSADRFVEANSVQQQSKRVDIGHAQSQQQDQKDSSQSDLQSGVSSRTSSSSTSVNPIKVYGQAPKQVDTHQRADASESPCPKSAETIAYLQNVFPNKTDLIRVIVGQNPQERDLNKLVDIILNVPDSN